MTELQIALDSDLSAALDALAQVHPFVDVAEIGTPLVFREGMRAVRAIRAAYPQLTLVADLKIMDAGRAEADIAFEAGADRATVMALANDATIAGALMPARARMSKRIMVDMMQVAAPLARARQLLALGCDLLCLHTAHDLQSSQASPYAQLAQLREGAAGGATGHRRRYQAGNAGANPAAAAAGHHRRLGHHRRAGSGRHRAATPREDTP